MLSSMSAIEPTRSVVTIAVKVFSGLGIRVPSAKYVSRITSKLTEPTIDSQVFERDKMGEALSREFRTIIHGFGPTLCYPALFPFNY